MSWSFPQRSLTPWACLAAGALLLSVRSWIATGHPLPLGVPGEPSAVRAAKLAGWLLAGRVGWDQPRVLAALAWEWLPALLTGAGLLLLVLQPDRTTSRSPALPLSARAGRTLTRALASRRLPWLGSAGLLGLSTSLALGCFQGIPHVQDSIAQQFQAQLFAVGQAYGRVPRHGEFFPCEFLVQDHGRWYAQYPPGQAALLAPGVILHAPWLVNPVLGALTGLFIYAAARTLYGRLTAGAALALFVLSPFVWFMSAERMNHAGTLFWVSLGLWLFSPMLRESPKRVSAVRLLGAGAAFGLAMSTRPLCGLSVLVAVVLAQYFAGARRRGALSCSTAWTVVGVAAGILPLLLFNAAATGSPLRSGYQVQWGSSGWGFGQSQWGPPHTLTRGIAHLVANWDGAAKYLFEWPVPSLLPLCGLLFLPRLRRADLALAAILAALSLAYVPYFYEDLCLGPRFLYAGVPALVILSARGLPAFGGWIARLHGRPQRMGVRRVLGAAALCSGIGLATNVPVLLSWYGSSFWGTGTMVVDAVRAAKVHHAVVFIQDHNRARLEWLRERGVTYRTAQGAVEALDPQWIDREIRSAGGPLEERLSAAVAHPSEETRRETPPWDDYLGPSSSYSHGMWANTPWPERQDVIYALDLGARNAELPADYPGRSAWAYRWEEGSFRLIPQR